MYVLVMLHSIVRWLVLAGALLALVGARVTGDSGRDGWGAKAGFLYTVLLDVQVLIGLIIWVLESGWKLNAFFAYVHPVAMLLALVIAHFGRTQQKKTVPAAGFWPFLVSLALVVAGIPWAQ
ncbi:hypothetical protein J2Z79_003062 [Symbiobacterium terraclitae]|uniref:Uncharacterized protein n=1 Tax=Symbiobacterium terraclitae TaxID=557451 RepID=A0ABS4JXB2_9FIRM|nr:hypothetical protein [Symbiobacterium terraclitae]MBP2019620.1 hypothetical protein [Symbiobacterium terraclitae]